MSPPFPAVPLPAPGAVALDDWGLLHADGPDARSFLNSQLTQDMVRLTPGRAALAGYCSPKGRLLATFVVWPGEDGAVWLACTADLLQVTLKRLRMYVLRARCRLDDASGASHLFGVHGAAAPDPWSTAVVDGGLRIGLPGADGVARSLHVGASAPDLPALHRENWRALEVASGVPRICAATADMFVPQMVNFELVAGVDFGKGCYPGQEVVARSQYRGSAKRRAWCASGSAPMQPGQEVFDAADPGQPAGSVVLAAAPPGRAPTALVSLKIAAAEQGSLRVGAADGPALTLTPPPYPFLAAPA